MNEEKHFDFAELTLRLAAPPDTNSNDPCEIEIQFIDSGEGHYPVIKTDRWAFDNTELQPFSEMIALFTLFVDTMQEKGQYDKVVNLLKRAMPGRAAPNE